jgi:hypothetical protein
MHTRPKSVWATSRLNPLAGCVAGVFALASPAAIAGTVVVSNCNDSGSGSLRAAIGAGTTMSGDTIDMTGLPSLPCSKISLQTGAITINQASLTLQGPGVDQLVVTDKYDPTHGRVFNHQGSGTLQLKDLSVSYGFLAPGSGSAYGGCIYSKGSVSLTNASIYSCTATAPGAYSAFGGGLFVYGNLSLQGSTIDSNLAEASAYSRGGGAWVYGNFTAHYSTITNNGGLGSAALGGGLRLQRDVTITHSLISGNSAESSSGGIDIYNSTPSARSATISNSTISGNSAAGTGGLHSNIPTGLSSVTVAFNTATNIFGGTAPGATFDASVAGSFAVNLQSSLFSNNTFGAANYELDFGTVTAGSNVVSVTGAKNLIRVTISGIPPDTITVACPLLGPLRDNAGATNTHALLSGSPAIDAGNNDAGSISDQRGLIYARLSGIAPDIGAYEVQRLNIVFGGGFDGCPDSPFI